MLDLTEKEKTVFYGLIKWPWLNDIELSERIAVKRPTLTAIRNKFEKEKLYETIKVPAFDRIGFELLAVKYGDFNPLTPHLIRKKYAGWDKFPEPIFWIASDTSRVGLEVGENYTEIKKHIDYSERIYGEHGFLTEKGNTYILFPLNLSRIFSYLDFSPLLGKILGLGTKEELKVNLDYTRGVNHFHKNEMQVMYYSIKYPTMNDKQ
ncbi:MAG: hypothetical protein ABH834_05905, partial [Candidatus Altiarchaeota archaeon]